MDEPESGKWKITFNTDFKVTKEELEVMSFRTRIKQDDLETRILFYPESEEERRMKWIFMASCKIR